MKSPDSPAKACRHCRHYTVEGRRGGQCAQLNALVQGSWTACSLAAPVFVPTWDFTRIVVWQDEPLTAQPELISVGTASEFVEQNCVEQHSAVRSSHLENSVKSVLVAEKLPV